MRRSLSILLLLFFGLGPLAATLETSGDAGLPACCRRHGVHHCAMTGMQASRQQDSAPAFSAPSTCPAYPGAAAALTSPAHAFMAAPAALPSLRTQTFERISAHTRVASRPGRTHAGRGPPATI